MAGGLLVSSVCLPPPQVPLSASSSGPQHDCASHDPPPPPSPSPLQIYSSYSSPSPAPPRSRIFLPIPSPLRMGKTEALCFWGGGGSPSPLCPRRLASPSHTAVARVAAGDSPHAVKWPPPPPPPLQAQFPARAGGKAAGVSSEAAKRYRGHRAEMGKGNDARRQLGQCWRRKTVWPFLEPGGKARRARHGCSSSPRPKQSFSSSWSNDRLISEDSPSRKTSRRFSFTSLQLPACTELPSR
ncbi:uncharacterized protein LOC126045174 [Accipiter gentilis]|uniref:uncharacterized protein LOC126045174 n=1 Tax=Astur gentilis TaxID=8957 RepID=UPI00210F5D84|nr:uncharacterized protein LOC126045174 [Accipiter gentilis]